ncbi:MAG: hypothetical protein ACYC6A_18625 [Armatimonadota bacterium]
MILVGFGALLVLAGIVAHIIILIDAFQNEIWKGVVGLFIGLYLLYYAFVEFEHDYKWLVIAAWFVAPIVGYLLIGSGLPEGG